MKKILIKIDNHQIKYYKVAVRDKNDIIFLLLKTLQSILIGNYNKNKTSRFDTDYIEISIDKYSRIFVILDKKTYSFNFPFSVREFENQSTVFFDSYVLNNTWVNALQSIFYNDEHEEFDIEKLYESAEMASLDFNLNDDDLFIMKKMINELILFEPGYIRYDDDDTRISPIHPKYHLDICYSSQVTYKIETSALKPENLKDLLDISKKPWKLIK